MFVSVSHGQVREDPFQCHIRKAPMYVSLHFGLIQEIHLPFDDTVVISFALFLSSAIRDAIRSCNFDIFTRVHEQFIAP